MTGITRRDVIKAQAVAAAAAAAGLPVPALGAEPHHRRSAHRPALGQGALPLLRHRLLGDGGDQERAASSPPHGDVEAEVNRGLNCVKGYFLSKIMYGADRLTTPLLRKRDGEYDKDGDFEPDHLGRSLRHHGREVEGDPRTPRARRPSACSAPASGRSGRATPPRS